MSQPIARVATVFLLLLALNACDEWWVDSRWRDGTFQLVAIDSPGQMSLIDTKAGGQALVNPTIFSVGSNERYIVLAQHPTTSGFGDFDRSVTHYYVVDRLVSEASQSRVEGPLSRADFIALTQKLGLPPFSKTFEDLE